MDIENQQSVELLEFSETTALEFEPTAYDQDLYAQRMQEISTLMKVYLDVWHGESGSGTPGTDIQWPS